MSFLPTPFRRSRRTGSYLPVAFEDFFDFFNEAPAIGASPINFKVDVKETPSEYIVKADIPGVDKKGIDVALANQLLTISVENEEEKEDKDENYIVKERRYFSSQRSIPLALAASQDDVMAEYKNGVLEVRVKKAPESQTKKITVK